MNKQRAANYIRSKKHLLEKKDLETLYSECIYRNRYEVTQLFLDMGINPLDYMAEVPAGYARTLDITDIAIPNNIEIIESNAFFGCSNLTNIEMHDNVTSIGYSAFENCTSLTSVTIPTSVIGIGAQSFWNCIRLTNITYMGSKEGWEHIYKDADWDLNTGDYIVHCTDGDISKGES